MISTQRQQKINTFVQGLDEDELHALYHQLAARMRLVHRAKELYAMKDFQVLDRVVFHHASQRIEGTVLRINQRTISVVADDGVNWKISPQLLKKLGQEAEVEDIALALTKAATSKPRPAPKSKPHPKKNKRKKRKSR